MQYKIMKILYCVVLSLSIFSMAHSIPQGRKSLSVQHAEGYFTEQELSMLPDIIELRTRYYLYERTKALQEKFAPYKEKYGFGYLTIHHYGVGQIFLNRVHNNPMMKPKRRTFLLKTAASEFSFVLDDRKIPKYTKAFKLTFLPVVLSRRAEAYMLLEQIPKAIKDLHMALKIKPSYYGAYVILSQCYQSIGDNAKASEMIRIGSKYKKK